MRRHRGRSCGRLRVGRRDAERARSAPLAAVRYTRTPQARLPRARASRIDFRSWASIRIFDHEGQGRPACHGDERRSSQPAARYGARSTARERSRHGWRGRYSERLAPRRPRWRAIRCQCKRGGAQCRACRVDSRALSSYWRLRRRKTAEDYQQQCERSVSNNAAIAARPR